MTTVVSDKLKNISNKIEKEFGVRYCTNCASTQPVEGGKWTIYNNGLRRRWKCAKCIKTGEERRKNAVR